MDKRSHRFLFAVLVALAFGLLSQSVLTAAEPSANKDEKKRERLDRFGSPLPVGAIARLGTVRLRHDRSVTSVLFSPDGKTVISGGLASGGLVGGHGKDDPTIHVWDVATGRLLRSFGNGYYEGVAALAISNDGKALASGAWGCEPGGLPIWLWDLETGRCTQKLQWKGEVDVATAVAFSPDGKTLASSGYFSGIQIWDATSGKRLRHFGDKGTAWTTIRYAPDGKAVATHNGETACLWDVDNGKKLWQKSFAESLTRSPLAFSPDGKTLATGCEDGTIYSLAAASGEELAKLSGHKSAVETVAWTTDGKTLASGGEDGSIRLWDVKEGKEIQSLVGHRMSVNSIAFSPDGKTLASGSSDHSVRLWNLASGKECFPNSGHQWLVTAVAFSPDGKSLASGGMDDTLRLWSVIKAEEIQTFPKHDSIESIAFSPDGKRLACGGWDRTIRVCDVATGKEELHIKGHSDRIYSIAYSPNEKILASASTDSTIRLWNTATGEELRHTEGGEIWKWVTSLAFSPDGKTLASGREDQTVRLCRVDTGKEIRQFLGHEDKVTSVAFSPDGKALATGSRDATIRLWGVANGKELRRFLGHKSEVTSIAFSPDGRTLVAGGEDETVSLWEVASGERILQFRGHDDEVSCVSYCSDGRSVASGSRDFTILIWDVTGVQPDGRPFSRDLGADQLKKHWIDLADRNPRTAYQAMWTLIASEKTSAPFLKDILPPVDPRVAKDIPRLIHDLDDDQFVVRQKATEGLERIGELAAPTLRQTLKDNPSPEVARRVQELLDQLDGPVPPAVRLREIRAVAALEQINTAETRGILKELSQGAPEARLTNEAKASLERLAKHRFPSP